MFNSFLSGVSSLTSGPLNGPLVPGSNEPTVSGSTGSNEPAKGDPSVDPTPGDVQSTVAKLKEKLSHGMAEYDKLKRDHDRLSNELGVTKATMTQEMAGLKAKNESLEKELSQTRFNHKLKLTQLQKVNPLSRQGSLQDVSDNLDKVKSLESANETLTKRVQVLEENAVILETLKSQMGQKLDAVEEQLSLHSNSDHPLERLEFILASIVSIHSIEPIEHSKVIHSIEPSKVLHASSQTDLHNALDLIETESKDASVLTDQDQDTQVLQTHDWKDKAEQEKSDAIKASQEQLQKVIDDLQARLASKLAENTNDQEESSEWETKVYGLEEQITDLKIQMANRQIENTALTEKLSAKTAEYTNLKAGAEEKLKKLKGLLLAANKNMTDSKKLLADKETQVASLLVKVETLERDFKNLELAKQSQEETLKHAAFERLEEQDSRSSRITSLEMELEATKSTYTTLQNEFSNYKVRAASALQKNASGSNEKKVQDLMAEKSSIEKTLLKTERDLLTANQTIQHMQGDLDSTLERLAGFESRAEKWDAIERQLESCKREIESLSRKSEHDKLLHFQGLEDVASKHRQEVNLLTAKHEGEIKSLSTQLQTLNESCNVYQDALKKLTVELKQAKSDHTNAQADLDRLHTMRRDSESSMPVRPASIPPSIRTSFFGELPPMMHSPSTLEMTSFKEKEYQLRIQEITTHLTENEAELERLMAQQFVLKEELRRVDRIEGRENLNIEYLKNVVMSFLESQTREPLIPIIANVLHLSPDEVKRLKSSVGAHPEHTGLLPTFGIFG